MINPRRQPHPYTHFYQNSFDPGWGQIFIELELILTNRPQSGSDVITSNFTFINILLLPPYIRPTLGS